MSYDSFRDVPYVAESVEKRHHGMQQSTPAGPSTPPPTPNTLAALQLRVNITMQAMMEKLAAANDDKKRMASTIEALHDQVTSLQTSLASRSTAGDAVVDSVKQLEMENQSLRDLNEALNKEITQQAMLVKDLDEEAGKVSNIHKSDGDRDRDPDRVEVDEGEGEGEELMTLREECKQLKERLAARDEQRYSGHASDGLDSQAREAE